jgi:molybdopterin/thiamine biosynthesis adenylyltransferase
MNDIELVGAASQFGELSPRLLRSAPNEAAAILLCHAHDTPARRRRVLVREALDIPKQFYLEQRPDYLSIDPIFLARTLKRAREEESSIFLAHTHPFSQWPDFSPIDDDGEARLIPVLFGRVQNRSHGSLVLGKEGFSARLYCKPACPQPIKTMVFVGRDLWRNTRDDPSVHVDSMHDRNVRAFGAGQQKLQRMRVGIVGLGGMGSLITEQLAHLGVGTFTLVDFDNLEISNLNRVVGANRDDIGSPKVEVAKRLINRIDTRITVESFHGSIPREPVARRLLDCDLVFCCTDSHGSRAVINQMSYQYLIPVIDTGVRIDALGGRISSMVGRVQLLSPDLPCLSCSGLLDPEQIRRDFLTDAERKADPYIIGHSEPQPAVVSINGVVASLAVTMFLSVVAGVPSTGRHLLYLVGESVVRRIGGDPAPNCIVCSSRGAYARADDWQMIWKP